MFPAPTHEESVLSLYSDLYKNDYGSRPSMGRITLAEAEAWLANRPNRPCGYGDPDAYAEELADIDAVEAAEAAASMSREDALAEAALFAAWDYDVTPQGRVIFPAH
ncbi:hypothetical protein KIKIMORA_04580 [Brevundimonas phage vB_BpoS-Kikimora]|uniref:Uncharacterized protein n=1 Tax=Brevundimonas phage vB_BpoS-Kikimora TaxID=2948601 RepID=A0A9E7MTW2_9CAUD|nr:hypothetical protein KIKIMORA_04580 [Brevundimonas phage vB_BpoS-Kikimora]